MIHFFHDIIVVDESSMMDAHTIIQLFRGLQPHTKLYLVGDKDQLPPIQGACFFAHFVNEFRQKKPTHLIEKRVNYRTNSQEIVRFATAIQEQNQSTFDSIFSHQFDSIKHIEDEYKIALPFFKHLSTLLDPNTFFAHLNELVMLTPFNHEIERINQALLNELIAHRKEKIALPVLLNKSIHSSHLFNGDVGMLILEKKDRYQFLSSKAYFNIDGKIESFNAYTLNLSLGFCLSIHKSQGSEYNEVILILDEKGALFGKELLYTAATRAKSKLYLKGQKQHYLAACQKKIALFNQLEQLLNIPCRYILLFPVFS